MKKRKGKKRKEWNKLFKVIWLVSSQMIVYPRNKNRLLWKRKNSRVQDRSLLKVDNNPNNLWLYWWWCLKQKEIFLNHQLQIINFWSQRQDWIIFLLSLLKRTIPNHCPMKRVSKSKQLQVGRNKVYWGVPYS